MKRVDSTKRTTYVVSSSVFSFEREYFGTRGECMRFACLDIADEKGLDRITFTGAKIRARKRGRTLADILLHGNAIKDRRRAASRDA